MAGALDGIRVVDFGQYIAGPLATMLLADYGADVVRVDPPGGPHWDTPANATWNRNKRSVVLDLKSEPDRDIAQRLIEAADVVVENFQPGVMDRLGLGPDAMTAANPRLIYCSLPGFASDDPRAGLPAWEGIVAAATSTFMGSIFAPQPGRPIYTAIPISSVYAAFQGAVAVAMALNARARDGLGQRIEVPLFDATYAAIGSRGMRVHNPVPPDLAFTLLRSMSRQYRCRDGRWVMYVSGNLKVHPFLEAIGGAKWFDAAVAGSITPEDFIRHLEEIFATRTSWEWERFCEEIGTECGVCRSSDEWLDDPGALSSRIIVDTVDPVLGPLRGPGLNVRLSETPGSIRSPRPAPGADRNQVLTDWAARPAAPPPAEAALRSALEGVKVLDLCIILAGPTCGRTLAEFGADVIKIDSPSRPEVQSHNDVNRGKRSIVLDLKSAEGLEIFWRLVEDADVVVQNFRKGVAERLGIGYEAVRARRPDIVYGSLNTFGRVGPYADRPGHEQIAQAASGMQVRFGGPGARPALQPFPVNDYGTGLMGAYGVALALLHRRRSGQGQHVDTALAYTATMLQSSLIQRYAGKVWDEPSGQDALGSGPLHRAYEASDGWIFLAARPADLARSPELADLAGRSGADLERGLEERIRERSMHSWVTSLPASGIGVHRIITDLREMMDNPWACAHGLSLTRYHDEIGLVTTTGPAFRLSRTPVIPGYPAPKPGSHAASVLAQIGRLDDLERLVHAGVIVVEGIRAGS